MAANISTLQDASWQDKAYIAIKKKNTATTSGEVRHFEGLAQEIDIPEQSADFDSTPTMGGGRIRENSAEEDLEFTMTLYPIGTETTSSADSPATPPRPRGINEWFLTSGDVSDSEEGPRYKNSLERFDFGIAILFTNVTDTENETEPVKATSAIDTETSGAKKAALRYVYTNAQITGFNPDFGDRVHTAEVTFKLAPYDETGASNYENEDSYDTSSKSLPAVLQNY